ncbi:unnamed protein product [Lymnaea stagnalis]|uniref:Uncharacterized protein n=1 Tax=Lymnaea stagnalis TaxID=6523 RepID=A0AAV2IB22_LYMST
MNFIKNCIGWIYTKLKHLTTFGVDMGDSYYGCEIISPQPNEDMAELESLQKHLYSLITTNNVQDVKLELPVQDEKTEEKTLKVSGTHQNWEIRLSSITYKEIVKLVIFQNQSKALFVPADESRPKVEENFAFPPPNFTKQGTPLLVLVTSDKDKATGMVERKCYLLALNTNNFQEALHLTACMDA